ncbi:3'(2'),5'-bisphosphate nucleotidase CysQ [Chloropicon roscoffensis]|uniref:3'(2'),5'-bisphosphate nucleotidase CysQ n=1 Tax=Chloropicon roscoffensis TaxID=1461544 RepID=A0AAX4PJW8_9CHLO
MGVEAIEGDLRMGCDPKLKDFPYELNAGFLVDVARRAGQAIMEVYEGHEQDWGVQLKGDDSPLTKADLSANKVICDALSEAFPEIPITSEENKKVDWSVRKEYTYSWCVDPLDGTKEFLKRNG